MSREILEQAYAAERDFLSLLSDLVTRESPTHDEAACDALASRLEELMQERGFAVTRAVSRARHADAEDHTGDAA